MDCPEQPNPTFQGYAPPLSQIGCPLPNTGFDAASLVIVAVALLALGGLLRLMTRSRER